MESPETKNIYYKISVNLGPFRLYKNSRVYKISDGANTILPGIKYSLITLFFGWWGFSGFRACRFLKSIRNSIEALHINFTGGEDISKLVGELNFDERTNFVWNNLLRNTTERIQKEEVEIIIDIQDEYVKLNKKQCTNENVNFVKLNLRRLDIHQINREDLEDVFDALKMYNDN